MRTVRAPNFSSLRLEVEDHISRAGAEEMGVGILHVESGDELFVNPDQLYPMASVFKIPILIETLAQVDEGELSLSHRVELRYEKKTLPSGVLVELDSGLEPSIHDLLTLMIIISDNTATDLILERIGIDSIERRLRLWGLHNISIKMSVREMFAETFDAPDVGLTPWERARFLDAQPLRENPITARRSLQNNVTSPRDMCTLLSRLVQGELLSPQSTKVACDIMFRQQLNQRLPRFLPGSVAFAHKTGTFINSRNDAGIIFLDDGSHVVVTAFALLPPDLAEADPRVSVPHFDRVDIALGLIARSAFDAFAPNHQDHD
jgi:beta-lactamase class A